LDSECERNWSLSDFCCWKFQINSKKPGFGRKEGVEDMVTLGSMAQATLEYFIFEYRTWGWPGKH
jgi:hypothetical protein